jgi:hypothetical protein
MRKCLPLATLLVIAMLFQPSAAIAQSTKSTIEYKKQTRHALLLELPNTVEETEGTIVSKLKENGLNPQTQGSLFWKKNTQDGFYVFKETKLPALGLQNLDLYFKVMKQSRSSKATKLYLMMSTGEDNFVSPNTDESLWEEAKQFLDGFAENVEAYKLITESTSTPIAAGENHYLAYGFRRMLEIGAVDIVMPDLQKCGGLGEGQRIANLANLYYTPFAPHMVASFLGAMASCHVCASVPNFLILEWQSYFHTDPMFKEIVKFDGEMVENGFIKLSEKPGIGVEINEEGMKKYATPGVPFFV